MIIVYCVRFFSYLGLATVLPFYSLWLHQLHLFSIGEIAILVAILVFSGRFVSFLSSPFIGRFHKKHVLILMQSIAIACSLALFTLGYQKILIFPLWCFLSFVFGGTFSITTLSLLALVSQGIKQSHFTGFSYINIALNLSAGLGPFLGGVILHYSPLYFTLMPVGFLILALSLCFFLPLDVNKVVQPFVTKIKKLVNIGQKRVLLLLLLNFLMFIAYAQFYETFPFMAKEFITPTLIGSLFLLSGLIMASMQVITTKAIRKQPFLYLMLSHVLFLIGLFMLPFIASQHYLVLMVGVALISIAEVIFVPIYRTLCVKWGEDNQSEIALARLSLVWGTSNSLAAGIGLYWVGHHYFFHPYFFGAAALLLAMALLLFNRRQFMGEL